MDRPPRRSLPRADFFRQTTIIVNESAYMRCRRATPCTLVDHSKLSPQVPLLNKPTMLLLGAFPSATSVPYSIEIMVPEPAEKARLVTITLASPARRTYCADQHAQR